MADPEFLEINRIHAGVTAVIRKHKLNQAVLDEINAVFGCDNPTMRVTTQTANPPKVKRTGALYTLDSTEIKYRPGFAYIAVVGTDGVDRGQPLWVVVCPQVLADKARLEIRQLTRVHGFRSLNQHYKGEIFLFPRKGVRVERTVALKHPGLYLQSRWACATIKDVHDLVVVHPKK